MMRLKKGWLAILFLLAAQVVQAAIIKWDGEAGDGAWSSATNWSGNIVPGIADDVVLDNSVVTGNYTVSLPGGAIAITLQSLVITPVVGNTILLLLPASNLSNPGLTITGTGDALVLNSGAILKNSSGSAAGPGIVIANTFRINNGGRYIHNTSRASASIVAQLSTAVGTETGIFEYDVPSASYIFSLSGRTYGTLELSAFTNGATVSYNGNGASPVRIRGDLKINTHVNLGIGMTADMIIEGNYIQATSSVFDMQNQSANNIVKIKGQLTAQGNLTASGTGQPVLELNGAVNQDITITGNITNNVSLKLNNAAGATLRSALTLPFRLLLVNGKLATSAINILVMADNAVCTGGSSASFVEGPMKKAGNDNSFVFPVGKGVIYAPAGFNSTGMAVTYMEPIMKMWYPRSNLIISAMWSTGR